MRLQGGSVSDLQLEMPKTARFAGLKLAEDDRARLKKMLTERRRGSESATWRAGSSMR